MSDKHKEIEVNGPNVEEAVESGLRALGLTRDQVEIAIIDEGRRGLLGIGGRDAVVRLQVLPVPQAELPSERAAEAKPVAAEAIAVPITETNGDDEEVFVAEVTDAAVPDLEPVVIPTPAAETDAAVELVRDLLELMHVEATVDSHATEPDDLTGRQLTVVNIHGDDLGTLIGPRGETLDALQYISRLMVGHQLKQRAHFVIDVEGYRERRMQALSRLAERMANKATQRGTAVTLEAMPPHERRVIHVTLRDRTDVKTASTGEGNRRRVRIYPQ